MTAQSKPQRARRISEERIRITSLVSCLTLLQEKINVVSTVSLVDDFQDILLKP